MRWIQTYTGRVFSPMNPRPKDIDIRDIAHSLAMQCRFNGHCRVFYSVAEHCVRVAAILPPELAAWGLLHDAAEAYLSDLPRPVKQSLPKFAAAEQRLLKAVAKRFKLVWPVPQAVWRADDILLATEARDLMSPPPQPWGLRASPLTRTIRPVGNRKAERMFLDCWSRHTPP